MRTSFVLSALVVTALATAYGCMLSLEGLPADGRGGAGATSASSAGGATTTVTTDSSTTASSMITTTTGGTCSVDGECTGGAECATAKCVMGACTLETATHEGDACGGPPSDLCFDPSQCKAGECVVQPKAAGTVIDDGTPDNCTSLLCDGNGNGTALAEPTDHPPDDVDTDCSVPTCAGTTLSTKTLANFASCGRLLQFCFSGNCIDCVSSANCAPSGDPCAPATCNGGSCGASSVGDGNSCVGASGKCFGGNCCPPDKVCNSKCCSGGDTCKNGMCKP